MVDTKNRKSRGRPLKMDRRAATEAAMNLFWQKGYDAVGIAELSEETGVKPPSLYKAFGSKLGLLEAAAKLYAEADGNFVADLAPRATSADELVSGILDAAANAYTADAQRRGCLVLDGTRNSADDRARELLGEMRRSTRAFLAEHLRRVGSPDPEGLADYILVAMTGLSGSARSGVDRQTLRACAARMASFKMS